MAIQNATIQHRRGALKDFDATKMKPGELAVTTDGSRKVLAAFAAGDVKELASKEDVENEITSGIESIKNAETEALNNIGTGVDSSLSQKGKAADAKETGDKIAELKSDLSQLSEKKADNIINNTGFESTTLTGILKEIYSILSNGGVIIDEFSIATGNNIPEIYFVGDDFSSMTKENSVDLAIIININGFTWSGYADTKWQGNSSLAYDKKNFTIKLYDDITKETKRKFNWNEWGKQNKFVLKWGFNSVTKSRKSERNGSFHLYNVNQRSR